MLYMTTDGHVFRDGAAHLIGASLPTPAACRAAVDLLHAALAAGISLATLWQLANTAVCGTGLPAARTALSTALGAPQDHLAGTLPADDHIVFADLDEAAAVPPAPPAPTSPGAPTPLALGDLPLFDF